MNFLLEKKYINIGFAAAILILLFINIFIYLHTSGYLHNEEQKNNSERIVYSAETLSAKLSETEANRRGFIFTNDFSLRTKTLASAMQSDSLIAVIKKLILRDSIQNTLIDSLVLLTVRRNRIIEESFLQKTLNPDSTEIQEKLTSDINRVYINTQNIIMKLQSGRKELIRKSGSGKDAKTVIIYHIAGSAAALLMFIFGIGLFNRNHRKRLESEKALEQSMNWFYTSLKSIGDGVIVTNHMGDIKFMNSIAQTLTGWKEDDAKGVYLEYVFNIVKEDTKEKLENPVTRVFKSGKIEVLGVNTLLIKKNGNEIPIDDSAAPIIAPDGSLLGVILVFRDVSERRKAEREILRNQKFIQGIAESIPNILYVYEMDGPKIIYANKKIKEILGYSSEEVIKMENRFFNELMHPDDYRRLASHYKRYESYSDSDVMESEFRIKNSKGEWRWLHGYDVIFTRTTAGKPARVVGTALDVTEKKAMEEQLKKYNVHLEEVVKKRTAQTVLTNEKLQQEIIERIKAEKNISEAEEKFRSLVEYSLVGIYIIQDEKFLYTNPKFEEIFGYRSDEMIGLNIFEAVHPDYREIVKAKIKMRLDEKASDIQYTFKGLKKDGTVIDVEVRGTKMMYDDKLSIIGSLNDVTESKKAEEELYKSQEKLKFHIQKTPLGVIEWDLDFRVVEWNESAGKIFGFTRNEAIGKKAAEIIVPENITDEVNIVWNELISQTGGTRSTNANITKAGDEILCEWYNTPLIDNDGNVIGVASLVEDVTLQKRAEVNLKKSLKEKELLLQEIHHRVKNNLQIIVSLLKLQSKYIFDRRDLEIFNKSRARVETMSLIHEKLYKSVDLANINMANYLKDLTGHLFKAYSMNPADFILNVNSENVNAGIDTAIPCGLIINELVSNALKHAFRINQKGKIEINVCLNEGNIILRVCDNGVGLPKDFEIEKSDSLGLQLVCTLVKQLDGNISINSSSAGTAYTISFPELRYKERI
jgi:PAS domain S-box-containing protein